MRPVFLGLPNCPRGKIDEKSRSAGQDRMELLPESFYRPSASVVAPLLLGHHLLRQTPDGWVGGLIVETEAYLADDPACHGYKKETPRNRVMWGPPGNAYVYLIYGFHHCVNAVCQPRGKAEAVLIRAIEPTFGLDVMRRHRPVEVENLTNGPGKLCAALAIDRKLDGASLVDASSRLVVAKNPDWIKARQKLGPIITTTRIGITLAAHQLLRFYLKESDYVSKKVRK
jgi:DNA-3-methyladenine glycosylase